MVAAADTFAANSYEEARNQRLEENKRKFQDLGISTISKTLSHLTASPKKSQQHVSKKPKARNVSLDIEPRRSSRQRNPVPSYRDEVYIGLPTTWRLRTSSSSWGSYLARPLEEVRLASYEERAAAVNAAEKLQENFESGNPSFIKSMVRSHVYSCFWLGLPSYFCEKHLSKTGSEVVLEDEDGNEFDAVYIAKRNGLSGGWRAFALEHKLDDGDAVVFELTEPARFKVYIVRTSQVSNITDKEDIPSAKKTSKAAVKTDTQKRRSKRGVVLEMDESQPSPDSESNQKRRSKRGTLTAMDDSQTSLDSESNLRRRSKRIMVSKIKESKGFPDSEPNQKQRSGRGVVPEMDNLEPSPQTKRETSPKLQSESPKGCEVEQEVCPTKMNEAVPKKLRMKARANRVRSTESPECNEVKPEVSVIEKNTTVNDENVCVAKKPRKKVVKERLFRKRA